MPARSPVSHPFVRSRRALYLLVGGVALVPQAVSAHTGGGTIGAWQFSPIIWLGLILIGAAYIYATGLIEQRDPTAVSSAQLRYFLAALIVAFVALQSPIDTYADNSFWVHMIQHLLLLLVVPPFLLLGTPAALLRPLIHKRGVLPMVRALTHPGVAWLISTFVFLLWHVPALYNAAVLDLRLHALEHLCFVATALLFWWPVYSPLPEELPRLPRASQIGYLILSCQPNVVLGAVLVFSPHVLYGVYAGAKQLPGIAPLVDQQIGGAIMWVPGNLAYLGIISKLFYDWLNERSDEPAAERPTERAADVPTV